MLVNNDSIEKIIDIISAVASKNFIFNQKEIQIKNLRVAPEIIRTFKCLPKCAGCCFAVTLDWIESENYEAADIERFIEIDGKSFKIHSYMNSIPQVDKYNISRCIHVDTSTGYCNIHGRHPFSCDFALLTITHHSLYNTLSNRYFGRAWNRMKIDGTKGAICELSSPTEDSRIEVVRKLNRLKEWADYFEIETHLIQIIDWVENIPLNTRTPLIIKNNSNFDVLSFSEDNNETKLSCKTSGSFELCSSIVGGNG